MSLIAVTGASGKLGGATLRFLLDRPLAPSDIVAVVRDPAKVPELAARGVTVRAGDYVDPKSLERAFAGVDKLLFISTTATGDDRLIHHGHVVQAARAAGVRHIIYTSIVKPAPNALFVATPGHFHTEALIRDSGIAYTLFRDNLYLDLIPLIFGEALASGKIVHNGGAGRVGFVAREDIARALATALTTDGHGNRTYDITAPAPYGLADVAHALGKASGKSVSYEPVSSAAFAQALAAKGLPAPVVAMSVAFGEAIRAGEFDVGSSDCARLLGRAPESLEEFLQRTLAGR